MACPETACPEMDEKTRAGSVVAVACVMSAVCPRARPTTLFASNSMLTSTSRSGGGYGTKTSNETRKLNCTWADACKDVRCNTGQCKTQFRSEAESSATAELFSMNEMMKTQKLKDLHLPVPPPRQRNTRKHYYFGRRWHITRIQLLHQRNAKT